jgi:DNA-binding transcriptional MerR regulator
MSKYTTGELARLCGVSVRTVQYYDTRGILSPTELSDGGRRLYSEADLNKMRIICFLRELDVPLDSVSKLLREENSDKVISLILTEQEKQLSAEIEEKKEKLARLSALRCAMQNMDVPSFDSIGDVAQLMKNKKKLRQVRLTMILTGIPVTAMEIVGIILLATSNILWPLLVYAGIAIPWGIWVSCYYFRRVAYICPNCHNVFKPRMKEAFWANHTPTTRKLTCPHCQKKSFCVETYHREKK